MADFQTVTTVEVPMTTLMKIVKHCQDSGMTETMGVIMGTVTDNTCFVGNCFPHHSEKSIMRFGQSGNTKTKRTIVDKAVEHFAKTNYDNNVCGVYVSVPNGKLYSSEFIYEVLTESTHKMLADSQICIVYEKSLAELGMNPFTAFKFNEEFIKALEDKKSEALTKNKIKLDKLDMKIYRSGYDQAFLAEYVCPTLSNISSQTNEDVSMEKICCSFLNQLESEVDDHTNFIKSSDFEVISKSLNKDDHSGVGKKTHADHHSKSNTLAQF
jgi:proteasome lid subunit RPN8/RPN11